jgi:(p)ppGpp synthase/HD superfamily hydrolase
MCEEWQQMSGTGYRPAALPAELVQVLATCSADDAEQIERAFQFAAAAHAGQVRDEGTPFIEHPVAVAVLLWQELGCRDTDVILAALMHDVLEDCDWLDAGVLSGVIGERATRMVVDVTKKRVTDGEKPARDAAYLAALRMLPVETRLLKLADRIHNLRCIPLAGDPAKAARYLAVSRAEFIPLALTTDATATRLVDEACDDIARYLESRGSGPAHATERDGV